MREFGYEYDAKLDEKLWYKTKGKTFSGKIANGYALRSGRDALKAIAREYSPRTVLLPALSCESMSSPFQMYGHKISYYKLKPDYSIDLENLYSLILQNSDKGRRALFLYMDYFGNRAISDIELTRLKNSLILIEDKTHNPVSSSFIPDYTIFSLRKWWNIPDGGLLWGDIRNKEFSDDTSFANLRLKAQCMKREYHGNGNEELKKEYRSIFSSVSNIIDRDRLPGRMSLYSYGMLSEEKWEKILNVREQNAKTLKSVLWDAGIKLIPSRSALYVPFISSERDDVQRKLSALGIYNTIIWPICNEAKTICSVARYTTDQMLAAPCDQRYTVEDMEYVGLKISEYVHG